MPLEPALKLAYRSLHPGVHTSQALSGPRQIPVRFPHLEAPLVSMPALRLEGHTCQAFPGPWLILVPVPFPHLTAHPPVIAHTLTEVALGRGVGRRIGRQCTFSTLSLELRLTPACQEAATLVSLIQAIQWIWACHTDGSRIGRWLWMTWEMPARDMLQCLRHRSHGCPTLCALVSSSNSSQALRWDRHTEHGMPRGAARTPSMRRSEALGSSGNRHSWMALDSSVFEALFEAQLTVAASLMKA